MVTILNLSDGETTDVISSDSDQDYMDNSEEDDSDQEDESFHEDMDDEGDIVMGEDNKDNNSELENKDDESNVPDFLSKFHAIRAGKDTISKKEEERILALQKEFGYATKWMYAEDDELLPVHVILL